LAELVARVREVVGPDWEKQAVGRPHVLPLYAVVAVLFGLRHNVPDKVSPSCSAVRRPPSPTTSSS